MKPSKAAPQVTMSDVNVHDVHGYQIETYEDVDGWYWRSQRRVPRTEPNGPFATQDDALEDAARTSEPDELCQYCGIPFDSDGQCRCAEIDRKIDDALEREG